MTNEKIRGLVFASDLGGTYLRAALIDRSGQIHSHIKRATPAAKAPEEIVDALLDANSELSRSTPHLIVAASIAVPGTVDKCNKTVVQAPNLLALSNFGLKEALEDRIKVPVILENDANAAAVGEMWLGAAKGARNVVCITLGTGVGGGIILDGKLWRGTYGSAGELGHTSVDPFDGPLCKCGNKGCLEMFASATAIVRMTRELLSGHPDTALRDEGLTAAKVYEAGKQGDKLAQEIFNKVGQYLGIGIANLINVLGPEVFVIGGGVANGWSLFENAMKEEVKNRAFHSLTPVVAIKPAECGDNAGLLGAAHLAWTSPRIDQATTDEKGAHDISSDLIQPSVQ